MNPNAKRILVAEPLGKEGLDFLQRHARVDVRLKMPLAELRACLSEYDALIVRSATLVNDALLDAGKKFNDCRARGCGRGQY